MKTSFLTALLGCALSISPCWASSFNVDFGIPNAGFNQGVSTSATYTVSAGIDIFATGYHGPLSTTTAGTLTALYAKTQGGDEEGLGLANDPANQHEITPGNFIQLNLSQLSLHSATTVLLGIDSSTSPDAYSLYLSPTAGKAGTFYASGTSETTYTFTAAQIAANPYVSLTATAGNVLLGPATVTFASVPEPGTLLSLGTGLALLGLGFRRLPRSVASEIKNSCTPGN